MGLKTSTGSSRPRPFLSDTSGFSKKSPISSFWACFISARESVCMWCLRSWACHTQSETLSKRRKERKGNKKKKVGGYPEVEGGGEDDELLFEAALVLAKEVLLAKVSLERPVVLEVVVLDTVPLAQMAREVLLHEVLEDVVLWRASVGKTCRTK
jgi:hypothetical protein